jgi:hypothetical protein
MEQGSEEGGFPGFVWANDCYYPGTHVHVWLLVPKSAVAPQAGREEMHGCNVSD